MTLCCVISCFMLRCSAIILDDRNNYLSNWGGGEYQLTHSLGIDCLEIVLSILFQVLVHNIMYTACVQCGGGVCGSMREVCVSMCVCVQQVERWMRVSMCVCVWQYVGGVCVVWERWMCASMCVYVCSMWRGGCV